ncbi:MAG TPA: CopG family transcriptional regulator [Paraburkholderia sp.]
MKRTNIFLDEQMIARLKRASEKTGMSVSEFIRRAVEAALKKIGL